MIMRHVFVITAEDMLVGIKMTALTDDNTDDDPVSAHSDFKGELSVYMNAQEMDMDTVRRPVVHSLEKKNKLFELLTRCVVTAYGEKRLMHVSDDTDIVFESFTPVTTTKAVFYGKIQLRDDEDDDEN